MEELRGRMLYYKSQEVLWQKKNEMQWVVANYVHVRACVIGALEEKIKKGQEAHLSAAINWHGLEVYKARLHVKVQETHVREDLLSNKHCKL